MLQSGEHITARRIRLRRLDPFLKTLIWYSIALYLIELNGGSINSRAGHPFFLWSERVVASLMTLEYLFRWQRTGRKYPASALGIIDLISILPFWVGFFVPWGWLGIIRAMRILRLLKYFRYSRSMQLVALVFYRVKTQIRSLAFTMLVVVLFGTVLLFECEKNAPGTRFDSLYDSFVKVALTTMNCAAVDPVTAAGKAAAMLVFLPAMAVFAGLIGVLSAGFEGVLSEFVNPTKDPYELFEEARRNNQAIKQIDRNYRSVSYDNPSHDGDYLF